MPVSPVVVVGKTVVLSLENPLTLIALAVIAEKLEFADPTVSKQIWEVIQRSKL